jgi:hypothetical protein
MSGIDHVISFWLKISYFMKRGEFYMDIQRSDYKICPICGASLDLDEKCDCVSESVKGSRQQLEDESAKRQQAFISAPKGSRLLNKSYL